MTKFIKGLELCEGFFNEYAKYGNVQSGTVPGCTLM